MRPIRVLVAKPGLDGHDRGAKVVAAALRDAGMEVIYTGLHQTPEMIATAAVQEDVDVVGLSILSGAHMTLFPRVRELLHEQGRDDILITGGGIIPKEDMDVLREKGIGKLFGPGTRTTDLIDYIRDWFTERERQEACPVGFASSAPKFESLRRSSEKAAGPTRSHDSTSRENSLLASGSPDCVIPIRVFSRSVFSSRTTSTKDRHPPQASSRASAPFAAERS